jgi:hypothetical protein
LAREALETERDTVIALRRIQHDIDLAEARPQRRAT